MTFTIEKAVRENVHVLLMLAGGTGSGKTYTALRIARGLSGGKRFLVIDTEQRRARHHASDFEFDVIDMGPPFTSERYQQAVETGIAKGYETIVIDSGSHEWMGEGGMHDQVDESLDESVERQRSAAERGGYLDRFDEDRAREKGTATAWARPKMAHKKYKSFLVQARANVIICVRAEEKVEFVKNDKGKMEIRPTQKRGTKDGWAMIVEKSFPFEATASLMFFENKPGVGHAIKMPEALRPAFPEGRVLTEQTGEMVARWCAGENLSAKAAPKTQTREEPPKSLWDEVLRGIAEAETNEVLTEIGEGLAKLSEKAPDNVRKAFAAKRRELKEKANK